MEPIYVVLLIFMILINVQIILLYIIKDQQHIIMILQKMKKVMLIYIE